MKAKYYHEKIKYYFIAFFLTFFIPQSFAQSYSFKGKIIDADSKEPLAFVSISILSSKRGTVSDIDGNFSITIYNSEDTLRLTYLGYEPLLIFPKERKDLFIAKMKKDALFLNEITITPQENPAHRIIRKAIENKHLNNPEALQSFEYKSYNKFYVTSKYVESKKSSRDTLFDKYLTDHHIFLMESVSNRKFLFPDRSKETILATKVSGIANPSFSILASDFQSFSFYKDFIKISDHNYLSPISKGSIKKYNFTIEDTTYRQNDTVFIISFKPKINKGFDALKGILYINTNTYAIQNVIAEPDEAGLMEIKIQQLYEFINDQKWFPVQLNSEIVFKNSLVDNYSMLWVFKSYIEDIKINPPTDPKQFDNIAVTIDEKAGSKTDTFWVNQRSGMIDQKESNTYEYIDSIGKVFNFSKKINFLEKLMSGKLTYKFIDIPLSLLVNYNEYEKWRLGVGIHTNDKLLSFMSVRGNFAYGFGDKQQKYGAGLSFLLSKKSSWLLEADYIKDVREPGNIEFLNDRNIRSTESTRNYMINNMDNIERKIVGTRFHLFNYADIKLSYSENLRTVNNINTFTVSNTVPVSGLKNSFTYSEIDLNARYAYKEQILKMKNSQYPTETNFPIIWLQLSRGIKAAPEGLPDYYRLNIKIEKRMYFRNIGNSSIQVMSGLVNGKLPYSLLFMGKGSYSPKIPLETGNTFQTMRLNEFLSDQYVALFFQHNFYSLSLNNKKFRPQFSLVSNYGIGSLSKKNKHPGYIFKTMEKGYMESGIIINNVIRYSFVGYGVGFFYRYGSYSFRNKKDNLAIKFSFKFNL